MEAPDDFPSTRRTDMKSNHPIADRAAPYFDRLIGREDRIAEIRATANEDVARERAEQRLIYSEAAEDGIPPDALKRLVEDRQYERKREAKLAQCDPEVRDVYQQLASFGGGIGRWAADRVAPQAVREHAAA
jgi:hypothetical protein